MGHTVVHEVGAEQVAGLAHEIVAGGFTAPDAAPPLWDGHAGERIGVVIDHWLAGR